MIERKLPEKLAILVPPALLGALEIAHPDPAGSAWWPQLVQQSHRWLLVHELQLPLLGLVALSAYLLIRGATGPLATFARLCLGVFVVYYTALDSVAGLAVGVLARNAATLPAAQQDLVARAVISLFLDPAVGASLSVVTVVATLAWLLAIACIAVVSWQSTRRPLPVCLLLLSGALFGYSHVPPTGPAAMACFVAAAALFEIRRTRP